MELKKISKWIVISGALIIWGVKYGIRPSCDCNVALIFFLGIAPNLLGSFLIPFGACWFFSGKNFFGARIFHINSLVDLRQVCILGLGLLIINEYLQLIPFFGRTFDYFDILASVVGLSASYFLYSRLFTSMLYRFYPD